MKKASLLLMGILAFLFISSCTIQKRTVNKGYFVQWHWDKKIKQVSANEENKPLDLVQTKIAEENESPEIALVSIPDEKPGEEFNIIDFQINVSEEEEQVNSRLKQTPTKIREVKRDTDKTLHQEEMRQSPPPMDTELAINIGLLVLFLALAILFTVLALNVASGVLLYVYWGLAVLCFVIFVTQVIDVIMW